MRRAYRQAIWLRSLVYAFGLTVSLAACSAAGAKTVNVSEPDETADSTFIKTEILAADAALKAYLVVGMTPDPATPPRLQVVRQMIWLARAQGMIEFGVWLQPAERERAIREWSAGQADTLKDRYRLKQRREGREDEDPADGESEPEDPPAQIDRSRVWNETAFEPTVISL